MELGELDGDMMDLVLGQDRPVMRPDALVDMAGRGDVERGVDPYRGPAGEHDHREEDFFRAA